MHSAGKLNRVLRSITFAGLLCSLLTGAAPAGGRETESAKRHATRFDLAQALNEGDAGYRDGSHGVGQAIFPYSDEAAADLESGQPAGNPKVPAVSLKPRATLKGHPALVYCVRFTPDGKTLVSSSARGSKQNWQDSDTLIAWSVADAGKTKVAIPADQSLTLFGLTAGGKQAAVAKDEYVGLYDLKTGKEAGKLPGPGMVSPVCVAASDKGNLVAAGFQNSEILIWETRGKKSTSRTLKGHSGAVVSLAFSPDGKQLASGSSDHSARLWDVATGKPQHVLQPEGADSPVVVLRYSPDGGTLATAANAVHFWDPVTGNGKKVLPAVDLFGTRSIAFSPDGKLAASTSIDLAYYKRGKITTWDLKMGQKLGGVTDADGLVYDVTFSPDSKMLASGGGETVKLWTIVRDGEP
jgi:WD40 repeat protein